MPKLIPFIYNSCCNSLVENLFLSDEKKRLEKELAKRGEGILVVSFVIISMNNYIILSIIIETSYYFV